MNDPIWTLISEEHLNRLIHPTYNNATVSLTKLPGTYDLWVDSNGKAICKKVDGKCYMRRPEVTGPHKPSKGD